MFKNIFSFSGRIRRTTYWLIGLLIGLIWIVITILATFAVFGGFAPFAKDLSAGTLFLFFIWITLIFISLAAAVKRSHDLGNSGWLILIPIYNPFFLAFGESQPFKNQYGPNPKGIDIIDNENLNKENKENLL